MEETVSLEQIFLILKKKGLFIALVTIIGVALTAGITFFVLTPKYESSAQLIVQTKQTNDVYGNLQNNISGNVLLINTYKDMIKDDIVIDAVQEELKKEYQYVPNTEALEELLQKGETDRTLFTVS